MGRLSLPVFVPQPVWPRASDVLGSPLSPSWDVSRSNEAHTGRWLRSRVALQIG